MTAKTPNKIKFYGVNESLHLAQSPFVFTDVYYVSQIDPSRSHNSHKGPLCPIPHPNLLSFSSGRHDDFAYLHSKITSVMLFILQYPFFSESLLDSQLTEPPGQTLH